MAGQRIDSFDSVRQACDILCNKGPEAVVITLGDKGAMFSGSWGSGYIDAFAVEVQDTTGAGDAFCGALAVALAECRDLENAVRFAAAAAALACRVPGAQPSLPSRENIDKMLGVPDLIIKR